MMNFKERKRRFFLIFILFIGVFLLFLVDQWQSTHWYNEKKSELKADLQICREHLDSAFLECFNSLTSLASLFILHPDTDYDEFSQFALTFIEIHKPVKALQYADADTRITYVYPQKGNEITIEVPLVLLKDPLRAGFTRKAIDEKKAILQGPIELRQGGTGIVIRYPIFKQDQFLGLAIGVYDLTAFLHEGLEHLNVEKYHVSFKTKKGDIVWKSGDIPADSFALPIKIADQAWTISANYIVPPDFPASQRFFFWLLGSGFIILSVCFINFQWKIEKQLIKTVEEKTQELLKTNTTLKEREERYRALFETISDAVYVHDVNGKLLDVNSEAHERLGYTKNEILNLHASDVDIDYPTKEEVKHKIEPVIQSGPLKIESRHRGKNGKIFDVELNMNIFHEKGNIIFVTVARDITQRLADARDREGLIKELQQAIKEVKKLSGLLPICSNCKKIRDDKGYWIQIESYIHEHSDAEFSHGICQDCAKKLYPDIDIYDDE